MINYVYELFKPKAISVKYEEIDLNDGVIVKPEYMAICHADQRYYLGKRDINKLRSKLPMALIHECVGKVVFDKTGTYKVGQKVVLIPNVPPPDFEYGEIYENYAIGSGFLSSGKDGFMRELVNMPIDRTVPYGKVDDKCAAITEFVSVAVHAIDRFLKTSHSIRDSVGIWGDGSLAYTVANVFKCMNEKIKISVIGKSTDKLSKFTFADETFLAEDLKDNFKIDHAFECVGGEGSYYAIDDIIKYIKPQGCVVLMGVSENKVSVNTRDILEKGITLVGSSRSGRKDFENAVKYMEDSVFEKRISRIIFEDAPVNSIDDIYRVFRTDATTPFKTVFKWNL